MSNSGSYRGLNAFSVAWMLFPTLPLLGLDGLNAFSVARMAWMLFPTLAPALARMARANCENLRQTAAESLTHHTCRLFLSLFVFIPDDYSSQRLYHVL